MGDVCARHTGCKLAGAHSVNPCGMFRQKPRSQPHSRLERPGPGALRPPQKKVEQLGLKHRPPALQQQQAAPCLAVSLWG